ncbi:unnamed protein product [Penicillium salamii]|nr:unnamed protein product [Penicillium salamii]
MHAHSVTWSARTAMSLGRLNVTAPSLGALRPIQHTQMTSKQLTRLGSTAARTSSLVSQDTHRPQTPASSLPTASEHSPPRRLRRSEAGLEFLLQASRLAPTTAGVQIISGQDLEALGGAVMGLDPFVVLGLATAACGAAGWLAGPVIGNGSGAWFTGKKEFFDRIRRFRVDPSTNSIANPVPDYYGEKIGSVQGYRQWLKDQRAYNRKRRNFIA